MHFADREAPLHELQRVAIHLEHIGCELQFHIHFVRPKCAIGYILKHRLIEIEIPPIAHDGGYAFSLLVQRGCGEVLARFYLASFSLRDGTDGFDGHIHFVLPHFVWLIGCDEIGKVHFLSLKHLLRIHLCMEIAHVIHLLP